MGLFTKRPRLRSDPEGVFQGPLAHAFASGAHMPVANGGVWNAVHSSCSCCDARDEREKLSSAWGIDDAAGWERALASLTAETAPPTALSTVLELRAQASAARPGAPFDAGSWPDLIGYWCGARNAARETYDAMVSEAARVWEYEERMVADGVLPRGAAVRTVRAYDFGRAVNLARWGVNAGYAAPEAALPHIVRAGAVSMRFHGSWEEMSAGFTLGRAMGFDDGAFGAYYTDSVRAHRVLVTEPESPWRNLPWRM
ncbi:DUF1266 domain-containing protein [Nocardiopsis flavescens]|uniref:DUF1266 domain-containing protein n=1 Tax=Nocardiopsis flavescens TaxID=758803 RepID=A0A1M6V1F7_9ACTN|nr:DUF1266 domain-containing protein [Nocardiopsis flavescens]SHK75221.1 Protein of unknown function [Nocardiopsis flavescens]